MASCQRAASPVEPDAGWGSFVAGTGSSGLVVLDLGLGGVGRCRRPGARRARSQPWGQGRWWRALRPAAARVSARTGRRPGWRRGDEGGGAGRATWSAPGAGLLRWTADRWTSATQDVGAPRNGCQPSSAQIRLRSGHGRDSSRRHPVRGPAARTCSSTAPPRPTAPAPARAACSATRCASTCAAASRWSPPSGCTSGRSPTSCSGSCAATATSAGCSEHGVTIWDEWADADGELGPVYGVQWRSLADARRRAHRPDQRSVLEHAAHATPTRAGIIVSAWNVGEIPQMALPPCHALFQFYVADGRLSCQLYQRSADLFLGVPFNIASYALLTHMVAQQVGLERRRLRLDRRRLPHLRQPRRPGARAAVPRRRTRSRELRLRQAGVAVRLRRTRTSRSSATSTTRPCKAPVAV